MLNLLTGTRLRAHDRARTVIRINNPELRKLVESLQGRMENLLRQTGGETRMASREPEGAKYAL